MHRYSIRVRMLAGLVAAAASGLAAAAVQAEPVAHARYGDLDLRAPLVERLLARRIAITADRVCDEGIDLLTVQHCRSALTVPSRDRIRTATMQGL